MPIKIGEKLPNATFRVMTADQISPACHPPPAMPSGRNTPPCRLRTTPSFMRPCANT